MAYKSDVKYPLISNPEKSSYCTVDPTSGRWCRIHFHKGTSLDVLERERLMEELDDFDEEQTPLTFDAGEYVDAVGTSLRGYITATRQEIEDVFGPPTYDGNSDEGEDKVTTEWSIWFSDGTIATIYDWKRYEMGKPHSEEKIEWNIGGKSNRAVELVEEFLGITY
jgi:hypothetical protein